MRRFFSDADAPKGVVKLATLVRNDRTVGRIHLPLVWRTKLLREFLKEALDCESSDVPLDVDVQLRIVPAVPGTSKVLLRFWPLPKDCSRLLYASACLVDHAGFAALADKAKLFQFLEQASDTSDLKA